jgi:micrococcal nuclease
MKNQVRMRAFFYRILPRWRAPFLLVACCAAVPVCMAAAEPQRTRWAGVVTYVADGDTVWVRPVQGGKPVSVRVDGIDAPEICQTGGQAARDALSRRVLGRQVVVDGRSHDDYGRLLGKILLDGSDMGERLVTEGHAWSYRYRGHGGPYATQQALAEEAGRGIFADSQPVAVYPRVFRKQHGACPH